MNRLAWVLVFAVSSPVRAGEPVVIPTTPQVPPPPPLKSGETRFLGAGRVLLRGGVADFDSTARGLPLPTGYDAVRGGHVADDSGPADGGGSGGRSAWQRFKQWLCYQPTTRDALPRFQPHPYVGPVTGTFPCRAEGTGAGGFAATGPGTAGTGGASVCGTGAGGPLGRGRLGPGLMPARGCKGPCVPPSEEAFPGYHFAHAENPAVVAKGPGPVAGPAVPGAVPCSVPHAVPYSVPHPTYKPLAPAPTEPTDRAGWPGSSHVEPVKRPFTRP